MNTLDKVNILIITNTSLQIFLPGIIESLFAEEGRAATVKVISHNQEAEILDNARDSFDLVVVLLDFQLWFSKQLEYEESEDCAKVITAACHDYYHHLKQMFRTTILWFGFEDYRTPIVSVTGHTLWQQGITDMVNLRISQFLEEPDVYIDFKRLIAAVGIPNAYTHKAYYRWGSLYSNALLTEIANEIRKQSHILGRVSRKCLVLDCDNVLWGGILSEDGMEGVVLGESGIGRQYRDFQAFAWELYVRGVILAICSKNDEEAVLRMFREHSGMYLKEEQIACFRVNWNRKSENILAIAEELNIGLDSMVFVDDSIYEVEEVRAMLPEVACILYQPNSIYQELSCFHLKSRRDAEHAAMRTGTYRTDRKRKELQQQCGNYEEFLQSLETKIEIHKALPGEYARISELSLRTNQCTNGKRYRIAELKDAVDQGLQLYAVYLSDRFSNLGLIGAFGMRGEEMDLFCVSCRALGRGVEEEMKRRIRKLGDD